MRPRDLSRLELNEFDLLVVGGGIYGLASAYDASSRGLRVALVEAGDFGGGASFNHQKTILKFTTLKKTLNKFMI